MTFDEYDSFARSTAVYRNQGSNLDYAVLGLCGEAGEVANKASKLHRDAPGLGWNEKAALMDELGDVLWFASAVAFELGTTLDAVAERNKDKLTMRKLAGTIHGSGDGR